MSNDWLDEILKVFGDYGYHDSSYGDCMTCKKVAEAKQAILNHIDKALPAERCNGDPKTCRCTGSSANMNEGYNQALRDVRKELGIKAGDNE